MTTLAEDYFDEAFGFSTAGQIGAGVGGTYFSKGGRKYLKHGGKENFKQAVTSRGAKVGYRAGQAAYGAAAAGGAYLAYKGVKRLINKFRGEKNPRKKEMLKKQIAVAKQKIKK